MKTKPFPLPGYFTTIEAAKYLQLSKSAIRKVSLEEEWTIYKVGNVHIFKLEDVHKYKEHKLRTFLARLLGWNKKGLYRKNDIDLDCPICGDFAILWPPPPAESESILCINNHRRMTDDV